MIEDEEDPSWASNEDNSPYATADMEISQSNSNAQVEPHTNTTGRQTSQLVQSTKNIQRRLQNRLVALLKDRLLTAIDANMPTSGTREDLNPVDRTTVKRLATLKSLRLSNKKLAMTTAEFLFEEVLLHFTERSHAKLEAISQHTYKDYVRVIHIVPKTISGPLLQKKEFGQWLRGRRTLIDNERIEYTARGYPGPLVMPNGVKISRKVINFQYKEYSSLQARQRKLFATAEGVLQAAIGRLPQLKRVESGLYWDWDRRRLDIPPDDFEPRHGWGWLLKRPDISPRDDIIDIVWKAGACQTNFDMDQGAMILRAVARGRITSGARIDAGPLFRDLNIMVMQFVDPKEQAVVNTLMADTTHLDFHLKLADLYEVQETMSSSKVRSSLKAMTKLESLRFQSACLGTEDRFDQAFGNSITWPHLNYVSIQCVDSLDFGGLASLIHRHNASLRQLTLYDICYGPQYERRCNLWADLRAGALHEVRIWILSRRVAEADQPDMYWQHESGSQYVFSGGIWSPRLGSDLREDLVAELFPSFAHKQTGLLAEDEECIEEAESKE